MKLKRLLLGFCKLLILSVFIAATGLAVFAQHRLSRTSTVSPLFHTRKLLYVVDSLVRAPDIFVRICLALQGNTPASQIAGTPCPLHFDDARTRSPQSNGYLFFSSKK